MDTPQTPLLQGHTARQDCCCTAFFKALCCCCCEEDSSNNEGSRGADVRPSHEPGGEWNALPQGGPEPMGNGSEASQYQSPGNGEGHPPSHSGGSAEVVTIRPTARNEFKERDTSKGQMSDGRSEESPAPTRHDFTLKDKLLAADLEGDYWAGVFENKLGITSPGQLRFIPKEDAEELYKHKRYAWEENALRCFLCFPGDNLDDVMKKQLTDFAELMEKVKKLLAQVKDEKNAAQDGIKEVLNVSTCEQYEVCDSEGEDPAVERVKIDISELESQVESSIGLSADKVINKASGGLLLRGVCQTMSTKGPLSKALLSCPTDLSLMPPKIPELDPKVRLISESQFDGFPDVLKALPYNRAIEGLVQEGLEPDVKHVGLISSTIPTASCRLDQSKMRLSTEALESLKKVDQLIPGISGDFSIIENSLKNFFQEFGSHFTSGMVQFGGVLQWVCTYNGQNQLGPDEIQDLFLESFRNEAARNAGKERQNQKDPSAHAGSAETEIELVKIGGPEKVSNLVLWRMGLYLNSSTWEVVQGGPLCGVWEILPNHQGEFSEALGKLMKQVWSLEEQKKNGQ